jgi:septal ring factor EnvC (AmiA/AmiB activator)
MPVTARSALPDQRNRLLDRVVWLKKENARLKAELKREAAINNAMSRQIRQLTSRLVLEEEHAMTEAMLNLVAATDQSPDPSGDVKTTG